MQMLDEAVRRMGADGAEPSEGRDLLVSNGRLHAEALRALASSVRATG